MAAGQGQTGAVRFLLTAGVDPNALGAADSETALDLAERRGTEAGESGFSPFKSKNESTHVNTKEFLSCQVSGG